MSPLDNDNSQSPRPPQRTGPARELFGSSAVRMGLSTPENVMLALAEQQSRVARGGRRPRLGSLMQEMGLLTRAQLFSVLATMRRSTLTPSDDAIQIAARLRTAHPADHNLIVVSACAEGDGASTTVAQVATALALIDKRTVLLVDANVRNPMLHTWFGVDLMPGLTECIAQIGPQTAAPTAIDGLDVLPAGNLAIDVVSLLMSPRCGAVLDEFRSTYGWVIVDAPPMLRFPDAAVLAARANGVLGVVAAGKGRKSELQEMKRIVEGVGARMSGVIVTEHARRDLRSVGGLRFPGWLGRREKPRYEPHF